MAEYIERSAAIKAAKHAWAKGFEPSQYIEVLPAADVAPVVHAEWVVCGDGDNVPWMCSHCGKTTAHKYKVIGCRDRDTVQGLQASDIQKHG